MAIKHTPGPWLAYIDGPFVLGGDGTTVDAVTEDGKHVRREICNLLLDTGDGDDDNPDLEEDLANARLIAAAPDLLEACQKALYRMEWDSDALERTSTAELETLRVAINKATGGQHD